MKLINIGFGNMVNADKVLAVVSPESAPIKRIVQEAKEKGRPHRRHLRRRTKAVLIMDRGSVVLSALPTERVGRRFQEKDDMQEEEDA